MENVEPLRFLVFEGGGDYRVDEGFDHAVGESDQKDTPVERFGSLGDQGQYQRTDVAGHGDHRRSLVADLVDDQTENDDADGKRPETDSQDSALVRFAETKVALPVADDIGAQAEYERSGYEGDEAGPEELFVFSIVALEASESLMYELEKVDGSIRWLHSVERKVFGKNSSLGNHLSDKGLGRY